MTTTREHSAAHPPAPQHAPAAAATDGAPARPTPRGVQTVKFSFFRVRDELRAAPPAERAALGRALAGALER
ncbi:MAG: hypothetical protein O3B31_10200, partial [Chloroflexi bacterium]|nr:hypothetical protein [Chloroflexota bacterium]